MQNYMSLGHDDAQVAIEAIKEAMIVQGRRGIIAVADAHGELIGLLRLDGGPLASIVIATNKAFSAARERKPSADLGRASRDPESGFDMAFYGDSRYIGWGGGLPVVVAGVVVGAVAVSGLTEEEDVEMAQIGVSAIQKVVSS